MNTCWWCSTILWSMHKLEYVYTSVLIVAWAYPACQLFRNFNIFSVKQSSIYHTVIWNKLNLTKLNYIENSKAIRFAGNHENINIFDISWFYSSLLSRNEDILNYYEIDTVIYRICLSILTILWYCIIICFLFIHDQ